MAEDIKKEVTDEVSDKVEDKVEDTPEVKKETTEPTKDETKKEDTNVTELLKETETKVETLTKEVETLQATNTELSNTVAELKSVKENLDTANETIKEYEQLLTNLCDEKVKKIPEELQDLIPSNMTLAQKLEWIAKAESKNMFKEKKNVEDVEIGKPIGASAEKVDTNTLSASSLFSLAYNTLKK
ncbi:TPA: hypothetical protein KOX39_003412 [Clostridioides difficile]|nr:hypothetical protein [Clostridioides difficile]